MRCSSCPFYTGGLHYNACAITESEYFNQPSNCDFVNNDGTINTDALELLNQQMGAVNGDNIVFDESIVFRNCHNGNNK